MVGLHGLLVAAASVQVPYSQDHPVASMRWALGIGTSVGNLMLSSLHSTICFILDMATPPPPQMPFARPSLVPCCENLLVLDTTASCSGFLTVLKDVT